MEINIESQLFENNHIKVFCYVLQKCFMLLVLVIFSTLHVVYVGENICKEIGNKR